MSTLTQTPRVSDLPARHLPTTTLLAFRHIYGDKIARHSLNADSDTGLWDYDDAEDVCDIMPANLPVPLHSIDISDVEEWDVMEGAVGTVSSIAQACLVFDDNGFHRVISMCVFAEKRGDRVFCDRIRYINSGECVDGLSVACPVPLLPLSAWKALGDVVAGLAEFELPDDSQ